METGQAKAILRRAWERGFRHFDLAESYGRGRAELLFGQELRRELRDHRSEIEVATKSVVRPPGSLRSHVLRSLRRMQIDYIDLFYIHWPREGISLPAALAELERLRDEGVIRRVGVCNACVQDLAELGDTSSVDALQFGYSALWRAPERQGLLGRRGPLRVAYSPLAQGLLARSWPEAPSWHHLDHRPHTPLFAAASWPRIRSASRLFVERCAAAEVPPPAAALAWCLSRIDAAVVGARSVRQVDTLNDGLAVVREHPERVAALLAELEPALREAAAELPDLPNMFGYRPAPCRGC